MNIVEKEAKEFIEEFYEGREVNNLKNLKSKLTSKLYDLNKDRDKLDFLKILRQDTVIVNEEHKKTCKGGGCRFVEEREIGLFVIDQEIDDLNKFYSFEAEDKDKFTTDQESGLHTKLNDIMEELHKLGLGQEIIFEEIESLKNHFILGKKTWFQLLKVKIVDLTFEKIIDETIAKEIYSRLSEGFGDFVKQLD